MKKLTKAVRYCLWCGSAVGELRDEKSIEEFTISGLCQKCQDQVFGTD